MLILQLDLGPMASGQRVEHERGIDHDHGDHGLRRQHPTKLAVLWFHQTSNRRVLERDHER